MIGNILKSVCKYTGLCMIGTLVCTAYAPSAYADICFLPGGDCVQDLKDIGTSTYDHNEGSTREPRHDGEVCSIAIEPENEICTRCADGNYKNCQCASGYERTGSGNCIAKCKGGSTRQADGTCRCPSDTLMCDDSCMPRTKTGNLVLNPGTCRYDCATGTERVTGLEGCFEKCNAALGETHSTTTGKCECPAGEEHVQQLGNVCKPVCPANQSRNEQGVCQSGPRCDSPKILINGSCHDCSDYVLRDFSGDTYSDSFSSDSYSEGYYAWTESCRVQSTSKKLPQSVRSAGGACTRCHENVNLWKCSYNGMDVRNYADLCFAMGYTFKTTTENCSSPFIDVTNKDVGDYDNAVTYVKRQLETWKLGKENIFTGHICTACPFNSSYIKCDGQCNRFSDNHGDAVWLESTGNYTCLECPGDILYEGAGSTLNTYFCHRNDCPDGTVFDEREDKCVTQTCGDKGFKVLDPIDICMLGTCGLPSVTEVLSDGVSGGGKCQYSGAFKYTAAQAAKLTNAGYVCTAGYVCPGMYACDPAVSLAKAVRDNGGTCQECGSNPTAYQCRIGGREINEPMDLCNYLGYELNVEDYMKYFSIDPHVAGCGFMACGVGPSQYGAPNAIERYKCSCASGYKYTKYGCVKGCNPYCGYSDTCSAGDGYSSCYPEVPTPDDPEQRCYAEGYTYTETDSVFQCGLYIKDRCSLCPYTSNPKLYKCTSSAENIACIEGSSCWCCLYPGSSGCGGDPYSDCYSSDHYSDSSYMKKCGTINRNRCRDEGYTEVWFDSFSEVIGCQECPYPYTGSTLYKGCRIPNAEELCANAGYTTPYASWSLPVKRKQASCECCPEDPLVWAKNCSYYCVAAGYNTSAPTCESGQKYSTKQITSEVTCYTDCYSDSVSDDPTPVINLCELDGFYKASATELVQIEDGILQCTICSSDSSYIKGCKDVAELCREAGYTIVDIRGSLGELINRGATCTACPYSKKYWMCVEPTPVDPCTKYNTVACDLTTHECTDSVSGCGCLECSEPAGTICTRDQQCSQALNAWGRCEGTCNCTGVTCGTGETCKQTNACGNCVAGQCECPGTKCTADQICNSSTNACGNCTGTCVDKGCPTGYTTNYPGGCPDTATSGDGTTTCYGSYKACSCPSGKAKSCGDKKPTNATTLPDNTVCYKCEDYSCSDFGAYSDAGSCDATLGYDTVYPMGNLTCYECRSDNDAYSPGDGISNGGGSSGGGGSSCSTCDNYHCNDINCYTTTQSYYGGAVTTHGCEFNGSYDAGSCAMKCCVCGQVNGDKYGACASLQAQCTSEAKAQGCVD